MEKQELTVKEFAEMHGLTQPVANSVITFLRETGIVEKAGTRKTGKKGRASVLYNVPESANVVLLKEVEAVEAETDAAEAETQGEGEEANAEA